MAYGSTPPPQKKRQRANPAAKMVQRTNVMSNAGTGDAAMDSVLTQEIGRRAKIAAVSGSTGGPSVSSAMSSGWARVRKALGLK